jgi:hypothetical protein
MAKKAAADNTPTQVHIPDFVDVDAASVNAAKDSLKGGGGWSIPETSKRGNDDKKGGKHYRWQEKVTVQQAYRGVAKSGLMDVTIVVKSRPGSPNENKNEFLHFYLNTKVMNKTANAEEMKKHEGMTNQSLGAMATLVEAAGLMPKSGAFKASMLNLMFPAKGKPGAMSPLDGKSAIVNAHAQVTKKKIDAAAAAKGAGELGEEVEDTRISADSFLPDAPEVEDDEDEDEDEE